MTPEALAQQAGLRWLDHQAETLDQAQHMPGPQQRALLHYKTGAGKTYTALACVRLWGHNTAVVVAPPATHPAWQQAALKLGVVVDLMSHAKFRQKDVRLSRTMPVITDEFHLFGGHKGAGWKKLDKLAQHLQAPLVMASATPNYNDAERCYCIQHILDPNSCRGGFIEFLYRNCNTKQNPFGMEPLVDELEPFLHFADASEYLGSLPGVFQVHDDLVYDIEDIDVLDVTTPAFNTWGYNERRHRIVASGMEEKHTRILHNLVNDKGLLHSHILNRLIAVLKGAKTPVLIFSNHATVAEACHRSLNPAFDAALVTGTTSNANKARLIQEFRDERYEVLVGTATLATGTDGLDKVSDMLIILDDTEDDALRRQTIGRIMPRGEDTDATAKRVIRFKQ